MHKRSLIFFIFIVTFTPFHIRTMQSKHIMCPQENSYLCHMPYDVLPELIYTGSLKDDTRSMLRLQTTCTLWKKRLSIEEKTRIIRRWFGYTFPGYDEEILCAGIVADISEGSYNIVFPLIVMEKYRDPDTAELFSAILYYCMKDTKKTKCYTNTLTIFNVLINRGYNINASLPFAEESLLHVATQDSAYFPYVKKLLEAGAKVNQRNSADGNTPLHNAVNARAFHTVKILLAHKAHVDIQNYQGKTPKQLAQQYCQDDLADPTILKKLKKLEGTLARVEQRLPAYRKAALRAKQALKKKF